MATNFGYAGTGVGVLKLIHILFGAIAVGCAAGSFDSEYFRDRFFLGSAAACFLISIIYLIVHLFSSGVAFSRLNKAIDEVYHAIGALLLIVAASLFLQSTVNFNKDICKNVPVGPNGDLCPPFAAKVSAGAFGLINGILYLVTVVARGVEIDDDDDVGTTEYHRPSDRDKA